MADTEHDNQSVSPEEQITLSSRKASGGAKLGSVRYVLGISMVLAIAAVFVIWKVIAH
jgi:hypothetical protein